MTTSKCEIFLAVFKPGAHGQGRLSVDRIPVDDLGIRTDLRRAVAAVTVDEFTVQAVRDYLPGIGFRLLDDTVHPVSYGKNFFFDMHLVRT